MDTKWIVLSLGSLMLFGNYFSFDIPAAISNVLESHMGAPSETYQYNLSLFYSLYSLPNTVLPLLFGSLLDRLGTPKLLLGLSTCVVLGQLVFAVGITYRSFFTCLVGRLLFGIGGESLGVVQSHITSTWFKNGDIAFALGINLTIGRLGSVFNDLVSPLIAVNLNVPAAVWFGTFMCLLSFANAILLAYYEMSRIRDTSTSIDLESSKDSNENIPIAQDHDSDTPSEEQAYINSISFWLPESFWWICGVIIFMYGTMIPFNTIHGALLQLKWYPSDPKTAGQIMAIPDTISALSVPLVGKFVDIFRHRIKLLYICGFLMAISHSYLAMATNDSFSPLPVLCLLGFAYSLLSTAWVCIPLVAHESHLGTSFGIATSLLNTSLTLFPLIVAFSINSDPTYTLVEVLFVGSSLLGIFCAYKISQTDPQVDMMELKGYNRGLNMH